MMHSFWVLNIRHMNVMWAYIWTKEPNSAFFFLSNAQKNIWWHTRKHFVQQFNAFYWFLTTSLSRFNCVSMQFFKFYFILCMFNAQFPWICLAMRSQSVSGKPLFVSAPGATLQFCFFPLLYIHSFAVVYASLVYNERVHLQSRVIGWSFTQ